VHVLTYKLLQESLPAEGSTASGRSTRESGVAVAAGVEGSADGLDDSSSSEAMRSSVGDEAEEEVATDGRPTVIPVHSPPENSAAFNIR
jgi:hypothetical protein